MNDPINSLHRRQFLSSGLGLLGVGAALPHFLIDSALAGPKAKKDEPILVVIQLAGGNDGLSTVVPYGHDEYFKNRVKTHIAAADVLKIDDEVGFSPSLTGFRELLDDDKLAVIQGVGYPNPNRSHFTSMDIWHTADRARREQRGWIGRYTDLAFADDKDAKRAMAVRMTKTPLAIRGDAHPGVTFRDPGSFRYTAARGDKMRQAFYQKLNRESAHKMENKELEFVSRTAGSANEASEEVRRMVEAHRSEVEYPDTKLANSLKTVSALIAGGLSTRVYYVSQGGYDTHAGQKDRHEALMTELGGAVLAFQKDLAKQGNDQRVLAMTFSEFGRRVKENASQGCDHGKAGPMFLFGPAVKSGVHGEHPSLTDLDKGDLKHHTDFRGVYATVLEKWLKTKSSKVLGGEDYPLIDCIG